MSPGSRKWNCQSCFYRKNILRPFSNMTSTYKIARGFIEKMYMYERKFRLMLPLPSLRVNVREDCEDGLLLSEDAD